MNRIRQLLGVSFPLLQAGMGGIAVPQLCSAVANAGCAGVVALYKYSPEEIVALLQETRRLTDRPFGVNLIPEIVNEQFLAEQVQAILQVADKGLFFTFFGLPSETICKKIKQAGYPILIQIGKVAEAQQAFALKADALIVQGDEAGGHHLGHEELDSILSQILQLRLGIPLIAAGGIATGRDFARVCSLGASGCMCGTLFVATKESAAHPTFKTRILEATAKDTIVTDLYEIGWSGRPHRVLFNEVVEKGKTLPSTFIGKTKIFNKTYLVPRFSAAVPTETTEGNIEQMAMYCGTSCQAITSLNPVAEVIQKFRQESEVFHNNIAISYALQS